MPDSSLSLKEFLSPISLPIFLLGEVSSSGLWLLEDTKPGGGLRKDPELGQKRRGWGRGVSRNKQQQEVVRA